MNRFAYRVYCDYKRPTFFASWRLPREPHEISAALRSFRTDLDRYLPDQAANVFDDPVRKDANSIIVFVETTLNEAATDKGVKRCLIDFDLFGEKLKSA